MKQMLGRGRELREADRQTVSAASLRVSNEREKCGVDWVCMTPSAGVRVFICNE